MRRCQGTHARISPLGVFWLSLVLLITFAAVRAGAKPPDPRLLSLVPPGSQIVAGAAAPLEGRNRGNFLIFTRANTLDLADFFSIVGADASHKIYQVIFAASVRPGATDIEHSVLVSGDFDAKRIYTSAQPTSATRIYHGVKAVVLRPFERESAFLKQDRWLAILDSRLAIFGTVWSVQQEIDRFLSQTTADSSIAERLSYLRSSDDAWCLISSLVFGAEIPRVLKELDPAFNDIDQTSDAILFGIRYGRQIEFEYVVNAPPEADAVPSLPVGMSFNRTTRSLVPGSGLTAGTGFRRVVKIPRARYDRWVVGLTAH